MTPMTISQLEMTINQARAGDCVTAELGELSDDVNVLAAIYGELIYRGHKGFDIDSLDESSRRIVLRWAGPDVTGQAAA